MKRVKWSVRQRELVLLPYGNISDGRQSFGVDTIAEGTTRGPLAGLRVD